MNKIKVLENILSNLNSANDELFNIDYFNTDDLENINNYTKEYINSNNVDDEYFSSWSIIDNIQVEISKLTNVINKDLDIEYKKELQNNIKENGKREIIEPIKEDTKEEINTNDDAEIINLSILNEQRKIVKSSSDKIFRIIENNDIKEISCITDIYFKLNVINENIKSNKKVSKWDFIENIWSITYDLRKVSEHFYNDKRKHKTLLKINDDINNLIYVISPVKDDTNNNLCCDDLPF